MNTLDLNGDMWWEESDSIAHLRRLTLAPGRLVLTVEDENGYRYEGMLENRGMYFGALSYSGSLAVTDTATSTMDVDTVIARCTLTKIGTLYELRGTWREDDEEFKWGADLIETTAV